MSFESVWGFDPDEAISAQHSFQGEADQCDLEINVFAYTAAEQQAACIPPDVESQVYQLRRLYRM